MGKMKEKMQKKFLIFLMNFRSSKLKNAVASCGNNLKVLGKTEIIAPERITIGNDCKINSTVLINARSGVFIGDDVTLSPGSKILSTGYDIERGMETGKKVHTEDTPVKIGNHCWVGADAIILPGVDISGEYVIVAAGAVVTKDITESKVIVAGVPARIVKRY